MGAKPITCSLATAKKANPPGNTFGSAGGGQTAGPSDGETDPTNTTLFIGGLSSTVTEPELHAAFARCGEIVYTKIPQGKGCGFVQVGPSTSCREGQICGACHPAAIILVVACLHMVHVSHAFSVGPLTDLNKLFYCAVCDPPPC